MLTEASFNDFLRTVARHGAVPKVLFVNPKAKKVIDDWARTVVLAEVGNYTRYELDGRRWWSRTVGINDDLDMHSFPRLDGEGWTPYYHFNRHMRRRGYPAAGVTWEEMDRLFPRSRA